MCASNCVTVCVKPGSNIRRKAPATASQAISGEMGTYAPVTAEDRR